MVRIRLRRVGAKNQPSYRIVVADKRSPRDGRFIETIGFYNPRTEPSTMEVNEERALHWLSNGAQPSEAVEVIFRNLGTAKRFERMKQGEALEALLAEAAEEAEARGPVDPRTRRDDLVPAAGSKKAAPVEEVEEAEAEVEEAEEETAEEAVEEAPAEETEAEEEEESAE